MGNWKIGSRGGTCGACARDFTEAERHVSTLVVNEEAQLLREDLCSACWTPPADALSDEDGIDGDQADDDRSGDQAEGSESQGGAPAGTSAEQPLFWWFTRYFEEKKKKTLQLDLAALEQIFVSLEGREEEPVRELRYLLCLILMRKRRVKLEKLERGAEGESFLVKRPRRDQRFRVFVFDFSPERIAELRTQLQALFDGADLETDPDKVGVEGEDGEQLAQDDADLEAEEGGSSEDVESAESITVPPSDSSS